MADKAIIAAFKQIELLKKRIERDTAEIYASTAIILHRKGWSLDEIADFFEEVGELWAITCDEKDNIVEKCKKETGLDIRNSM